ncbi:MAG: HPr family phosphocarrier protein [Succinivibrio sp.]|jgi:phosphocarrier protein|nr:HPr family phosphocarrier protein [Succinivibrio sp.]
MVEFEYTIKDRDGVHARPAGAIIKAASGFKSDVSIQNRDRQASLKSGIFALLGMGIRCADTIKVTCKGEDEQNAAAAMKKAFEEYL